VVVPPLIPSPGRRSVPAASGLHRLGDRRHLRDGVSPDRDVEVTGVALRVGGDGATEHHQQLEAERVAHPSQRAGCGGVSEPSQCLRDAAHGGTVVPASGGPVEVSSLAMSPLPAREPRAWLTDPVESGPAAGFGVYLHVPFCHHRCGYCDFATAAVGDRGAGQRQALFRRYVAALTTDFARQVAAGGPGVAGPAVASPAREPTNDGSSTPRWPVVTSVFVGGGTPTLLGGPLLAEVVRSVSRELDVADDAEITVECNPETASPELFAALVEVGVTRVSMGAQSFAPHVLAALERGHTPERPLEAVAQARAAGIGQVSLDLIYGTPGESDADWRHTLEVVRDHGVEHVSAYALTIHDNTAFGRAVATGRMPTVDEDVQRDRFEVAREVLGAAGFEHYEVSNWARGATRRSRHNLLYWRHGDYLGVGVGAHAHLAGRRWWSTRATDRYLATVEAGRLPVAGSEDLSDDERALERLLLGLRVREGLHPNDLPSVEPVALEDALAAGLVETACGRLRCTDAGWFLLDEAVARLRP
jgi:putative oxygen-independent coproporphyrinogen III oxidase